MTQNITLDRIADIAENTVAGFPPEFAKLARPVVIQVIDRPTLEMMRALDIDDPLELTGLYDGIPLTEKSLFDQPFGPDLVWLFRDSILNELSQRPNENLTTLVAHITVHEFAHHFGWSDADIAAIDKWWE